MIKYPKRYNICMNIDIYLITTKFDLRKKIEVHKYPSNLTHYFMDTISIIF